MGETQTKSDREVRELLRNVNAPWTSLLPSKGKQRRGKQKLNGAVCLSPDSTPTWARYTLGKKSDVAATAEALFQHGFHSL